MTKFMTFNKEGTRVRINHWTGVYVYSGELDNEDVISIDPYLTSHNVLLRKLLQWFSGDTYVPYREKEIYSVGTTTSGYMWLKLKGGNRIYKIYKKTSNKPSNSSIIYPDGKVMLKGLGNFVWEDFVEIVFYRE